MDLNAVRMFVGVVQAGSFSKASERLGIPLATLSRNIAALEKSLGIQLLERAKTGVAPTLTGQKFYEQSCLGIDSLLEAERHLRQDEQQFSGKLRIATPPSFLPAWDWMAQFQQRYPNVQVHCTVSARLMDFFSDGIDAAFRFGDLHTDNVIAKPVARFGSILAASPQFVQQHGIPQTLGQLARFPCATWSDGGAPDFGRIFRRTPPPLNTVFSSNDLHAVLHHALQGRSIAILPPYCAAEALQNGSLTEVLPDEPKHDYPVHLIYPAHKHPSALLQAFAAFCMEQQAV
ncbi:LysR family transcriptional regulator [Neisseria sp.]|uniref:LysR family transcriptional regulator n=1 Tax=Neisseria sp. TaxID=192066 RepID=UPI0035A0EEB3